MKHTQGKFKVLHADKAGFYSVYTLEQNEHKTICKFYYRISGASLNQTIFSKEEAGANAILISEAPETKAKLQKSEAQRDELLKLCKLVMKSTTDGSFVVAKNWWLKMEDLIKKITKSND